MGKIKHKKNYIQIYGLIKILKSAYCHNIEKLKECYQLELCNLRNSKNISIAFLNF